MKTFIDQLGREVSLKAPPRRIISLVPSQSELLHYLGLEEEVVGITKFCVHPTAWFRTKTRIGGTKKLDLNKITALHPDLIIGNKEENEREQMEWLMQRFPVWMSDISNLESALEMIQQVGILTGKNQKGLELSRELALRFSKLALPDTCTRTAYFIWKNPLMVAGGDTFINDILRRGGFVNVFEKTKRYPQITEQTLRETSPELILLSSEPFPFNEKHLSFFQQLCPAARVEVVDGEVFSWYGSRLLHTASYLQSLQQTT